MDVDRQAMHDAVEQLADKIEADHEGDDCVYTTTVGVLAHVGFTEEDGVERDAVEGWCTDDRRWAQAGFYRRAMLNAENAA